MDAPTIRNLIAVEAERQAGTVADLKGRVLALESLVSALIASITKPALADAKPTVSDACAAAMRLVTVPDGFGRMGR
jgi:hypothetical protein